MSCHRDVDGGESALTKLSTVNQPSDTASEREEIWGIRISEINCHRVTMVWINRQKLTTSTKILQFFFWLLVTFSINQ
jgi:hypothetical protein